MDVMDSLIFNRFIYNISYYCLIEIKSEFRDSGGTDCHKLYIHFFDITVFINIILS